MSFPPEFSSTLTYENKYDLDEIDVFLEGNPNNPMFFSIDGLPNQLAYGKHYFYISILDSRNQDYKLRDNSKILFEFKSKNNVVIKSDVTKLNQRNGVATCFVEVLEDPLTSYEEIEDGEGTLTVVGSLQNKPNNNTRGFGDDLGLDDYDLSLPPPPSRLTNQNNSTRGFGDDLGLDNPNRIPKKFQGAMNYRCTFSIQIRKNLINADSPKVLQSKHELKTALGRFSFSKASISTPANSGVGYIFSPTGVPVNPPQILKRGS
tara:strand:- start:57 stop:842 length:786 start_codon:yes stop_codon:yes gene_type:complete